jgi:uracil-DNA glycosylase
LTVRSGEANSHAKFGWDTFTNAVIEILSEHRKDLVFMLWGSFARSKKSLIQGSHLVLESAHPSPLSAYNGFFGNGHFKLCNQYLDSKAISPIKW